MPTKAQQRFNAWSYSRLGDYKACPLKAKLKHLDRIKEPGSPAMDRGSAIHKLAEQYATGQLKKLPAELQLFKAEFAELLKRKKVLQAEQQLAFDKGWRPCDWFGPQTWVRVVMDLFYVDADGVTAHVIDWKTGKVRDEHEEQLELYAIAAFIVGPPTLETVETTLAYLDQGEVTQKTYTRAEAEALKAKWEKATRRMLTDTTFKPTPSHDACRWCWFGQSGKVKGGPGVCKF